MRYALTFACLFIATSAAAESLLVELSHWGSAINYAMGQRVSFGFYANGYPDTRSADFSGLYTTADIGKTFSVDPNEIADSHFPLTEPSAEFLVNSGQAWLYGVEFDVTEFWTGGLVNRLTWRTRPARNEVNSLPH